MEEVEEHQILKLLLQEGEITILRGAEENLELHRGVEEEAGAREVAAEVEGDGQRARLCTMTMRVMMRMP